MNTKTESTESFTRTGQHDGLGIYFLSSIEPTIEGYYAVDESLTDDGPDDFVWINRGNGPEIKNESVYGPFVSLESLYVWCTLAKESAK